MDHAPLCPDTQTDWYAFPLVQVREKTYSTYLCTFTKCSPPPFSFLMPCSVVGVYFLYICSFFFSLMQFVTFQVI